MKPLIGSRPNVVVYLMGGLGNQMFQYAFGRRLALVNSAELVLDATGYGAGLRLDPLQGIRSCGLQHFRVEARIIHAGDVTAGKQIRIGRWMRKAGQAARRIADEIRPYYQRQYIVEPTRQHHRFDGRMRDRRFRGTLAVRGFWQTEGYFVDIQEKIRSELTLREELSGKNLELAGRIHECNSVAIHVRHGDNATKVAAALGVLQRDYYDRALEHVSRNVPNPHYFVFSEDIPWARGILGDHEKWVYVEQNNALKAHEDLRLMTLCKHHIIANSTFSWWGAWLGKKDGQLVVAPRRYYLGVERPNPDLYPRSWRLV